MKQSFYAVGLLMLILSGQASAQTSETSFITRESVLVSPFLRDSKAIVPIAAAAMSSKIMDRFNKNFKEAKDVEWVGVPNGYRAYFLEDGVLTAVDYTKKGKLYSVIRYGKDLLSPYVEMKLEKTFGGLQIRDVAEVKIADFATKAYVVVVQDKTSLKTLQIIEDEISVIQEVEK